MTAYKKLELTMNMSRPLAIAKEFILLTVVVLLTLQFDLSAAQGAAPGVRSPRSATGPAQQHAVAKATPLGWVRSIYRGLTVQPPHRKRERGTVKMPLFDHYFLETGPGQDAAIRFRDGTTLYMSQRTDVTLRSKHVTYLGHGQVDEVVAQGTDHRVKTPRAVAVARGTNFDVKVVGHKTYLFVIHGTVEMRNSKGTVLVQPNQETIVVRTAAPQPPRPADAAATITWTSVLPPPNLVEVTSVTSGSFQVSFTSKRPGLGQVLFGSGPGCSGLVNVATRDQGSGTTRHIVLVLGNDLPGTVGDIGITPGARYFFEVASVSSRGTEIDNNHGKCYTVLIPSKVD